MIADPVGALVELLKADADTAAIANARVFGGELPEALAAQRPQAAIVLTPSGGLSLTGGSYVEHDTKRVDAFAYGATQNEANTLLDTAALAFRRVKRQLAAGTLVHWVQPAGGAIGGRDPALAWPRAFQSFQVFHALETVS